MLRRFVIASACALLVLAHVSPAAAAWRLKWVKASHTKTHVQQTTSRSVVKPGAYPRTRQIDGKTLWDLGKQKGQWPKLP